MIQLCKIDHSRIPIQLLVLDNFFFTPVPNPSIFSQESPAPQAFRPPAPGAFSPSTPAAEPISAMSPGRHTPAAEPISAMSPGRHTPAAEPTSAMSPGRHTPAAEPTSAMSPGRTSPVTTDKEPSLRQLFALLLQQNADARKDAQQRHEELERKLDRQFEQSQEFNARLLAQSYELQERMISALSTSACPRLKPLPAPSSARQSPRQTSSPSPPSPRLMQMFALPVESDPSSIPKVPPPVSLLPERLMTPLPGTSATNMPQNPSRDACMSLIPQPTPVSPSQPFHGDKLPKFQPRTTITPFLGQADSRSIHSWLSQMGRALSVQRIPGHLWVYYTTSFLDDAVLQRMSHDRPLDEWFLLPWPEFCLFITQQFPPAAHIAKLQQQVTNLHQGVNESITDYTLRTQRYVDELLLYKSEAVVFQEHNLLQQFANGFLDPDLRLVMVPIAHMHPATAATLSLLAQKAFAFVKPSSMAPAPQPICALQPSSSTPGAQTFSAPAQSSGSPPNYFCTYCKRSGHTFKYCRKKKQADRNASSSVTQPSQPPASPAAIVNAITALLQNGAPQAPGTGSTVTHSSAVASASAHPGTVSSSSPARAPPPADPPPQE